VGIGYGEDIVPCWLDRAPHPRRRQPGDRRSAATEAGNIAATPRGRRLDHAMLLALWRSMHAQRGSELGNGTADERSGTLMRACMDRTLRSRRTFPTPHSPATSW
jgi:hypothetical protein